MDFRNRLFESLNTNKIGKKKTCLISLTDQCVEQQKTFRIDLSRLFFCWLLGKCRDKFTFKLLPLNHAYYLLSLWNLSQLKMTNENSTFENVRIFQETTFPKSLVYLRTIFQFSFPIPSLKVSPQICPHLLPPSRRALLDRSTELSSEKSQYICPETQQNVNLFLPN